MNGKILFMRKWNKLPLILVVCLALGTCTTYNRQDARNSSTSQNANGRQSNQSEDKYYEFDSIDMIIVNKIPRGTFAGEQLPEGYEINWYDIGLSRNGEEPVEYIWRVREAFHLSRLVNAEIGTKGTIYIGTAPPWVDNKYAKRKLPLPNTMNPAIIESLEGIFWEQK